MAAQTGVILWHGVGDDGACWAPFIASLGPLPGVVLRTPDAPAHGGRRAGPGQQPSWHDRLAEGIATTEALVQSVGGPVIVGGHSMGSTTALGVAAERPELVTALFLEDPPFAGTGSVVPGDEPMASSQQLYDWLVGLQSASLAEVSAGARYDHPDWPDDEYEPWARAKQAVDVTPFAEPVPWIGGGWRSLAPRVSCPVVVVAGQEDMGSLLTAEAEAVIATLPGWVVHRVPAGHDVRRDARQATGQILRALIEGSAG